MFPVVEPATLGCIQEVEAVAVNDDSPCPVLNIKVATSSESSVVPTYILG